MELDIILVTYNSEKWINMCLNSLASCLYNKNKMHIFIVDNDSSDSTIQLVKENEILYKDLFASFCLIQNKINLGFGRANNLGFKNGNSEYILFLNIDTEITNDALIHLIRAIEESDNRVAAWELRQFPYEHPKFYDPVTHYTSWLSGAAFIVKRNVFAEVQGFDPAIFLYAEDVDLSWRIRARGYKLQYVPDAVVNHYSYEEVNQIKPVQYTNSVINNLNLRLRYGSTKDIILGVIKFILVFLKKQPFDGARKYILIKSIINIPKIPKFFFWRFFKSVATDFSVNFVDWDYEVMRTGGFYKNTIPQEHPLVSILIRTHGRIDALKEALISVRNQTYKNIEVVVIEDGGKVSEKMIADEFSDLNIVYISTGQKVGRSIAANIAIETAKGEYLNFLDDDDLLFSDHVEVLVNEFLNQDSDVVYSVAFEVPTKFNFSYSDKINVDYKIVYRQPFNRMKLFYQNYLPIQSVMFKREIAQNKIFMDDQLNALEDWDFWIKLSLENDFRFVDKTTSLYRIPYDLDIAKNRKMSLDQALSYVREKQKGYFTRISAFEASGNVAELLSKSKTDRLKRKFRFIYKIYLLISKVF